MDQEQELVYYTMWDAKEIANRCRVSEQDVRVYMKKTHALKENGRYFVTGEIMRDIIAHCSGSDVPEQPETDENGEIIDLLKSQIEAQKSEIEILRSILTQQQKLMEQMNKTLDFIQNQAKIFKNNE